MLTLDELEQQMKPWSRRIWPRWLSLMGGEPTLNPSLPEMVELSARMWQGTKVRVITNGFFLHRFPELPKIMVENNCQLRISIHHDGKEYQEKLEPITKLVKQWQKKWSLEVEWKHDYRGWLRVYKGFGHDMLPFEDGRPQESWAHCGVKWCKQIYLGKLWKCPNVAYLQMQDKKYNLSDKWLPYLTYRDGSLGGQALEPTARLHEIRVFYEQEHIPHCAMCPAKGTHNHFKLLCPLRR